MGVDICIVDESLSAHEQIDGASGYIRSSYNSQGLFRVLDKVYGFDVAGALFPGDWEQNLNINFEEYLAMVKKLEDEAMKLRDGDRLPIKSAVTAFGKLPTRKQPPLIFKVIIWLLNRKSEKSEQQKALQSVGRVYRDAVHGPLIRDGLKELREFGELGQRLSQNRKPPVVSISF